MTAVNYQTIKVTSRANHVAQITMARPEVFNAFDETMIRELDQAFTAAAADNAVRVIVLAGEGKHFSAGADLKWMRRASEADFDWNLQDARVFAEMLGRIDACPKPVVAQVQGAALGGGTGLVCVCDIAIATEQARFALSEAKFGIVPAIIGPYLINTIGKRQARRLALTTTPVYAAEALGMDLIHQQVAEEELDNAVDQVVSELLAGSPNAQREIKALFAQLEIGPVNAEVRELTAQTISRVRGTAEAKEGFAAFLDKRPASWMPED